jgi:starvation-inducible DNA-binding protein
MALADSLKVVLATTAVYEQKAQQFHWNLQGPMFHQLHEMFGAIYEDAEGAIDPTAEYIRTLKVFAPTTYARFIELSVIEEQPKIPSAMLMVKELYDDGEKILELLKKANKEALDASEDGIANFLADRMSAHGKFCWQLDSLMK